jgi:hypothetical protein
VTQIAIDLSRGPCGGVATPRGGSRNSLLYSTQLWHTQSCNTVYTASHACKSKYELMYDKRVLSDPPERTLRPTEAGMAPSAAAIASSPLQGSDCNTTRQGLTSNSHLNGL